VRGLQELVITAPISANRSAANAFHSSTQSASGEAAEVNPSCASISRLAPSAITPTMFCEPPS